MGSTPRSAAPSPPPSQPLAILAGAGSGKTRVLTRRIAHRCLTGDRRRPPRPGPHVHPQGRRRARHPAARLRPARPARRRHVPRRRLRPAPHPLGRRRHRGAHAARPQGPHPRPDPRQHHAGHAVGPGRRDRVGQGPPRLARPLPDRRARRPTAASPVDPERVAEWYRRYEAEKRKRGLVDFDDLLAPCADAIEHRPVVRRRPALAVPPPVRRRVPGREPAPGAPAAGLARRPARPGRGGRSRTRRSTAGTAPTPSFLLDFAAPPPRRRGGRARALLPVDAADPPHRGRGARRRAGPAPATSCRPTAATAPCPAVVGYSSDLDEAHGIARAVHDNHVPGRPVVRPGGPGAHQRPDRAHRGGVPAGRHPPPGPRRQPAARRPRGPRPARPLRQAARAAPTTLSRPRGQHRRASASELLGGARRRRRRPTTEPTSSVDESTAAGRRSWRSSRSCGSATTCSWSSPPPAPTASAAGCAPPSRRTAPTPRDAVSIVSFHAAKGLEWPVVHLAGIEAGYVPISHARTRRGEGRGAAALLRRRHPRRRRAALQLGRAAHVRRADRRPQAVAVPRLGPRRRRRAGPRGGRTPTIPLPAVGRDRAPRSTRTDLGRAPARTTPTSLRSALQRLARRGGPPGRRAAPPSCCPTRRSRPLVRTRPRTDDELAALPRLGPSTRERHGARLLAVVAECDADGPPAAQGRLTGT